MSVPIIWSLFLLYTKPFFLTILIDFFYFFFLFFKLFFHSFVFFVFNMSQHDKCFFFFFFSRYLQGKFIFYFSEKVSEEKFENFRLSFCFIHYLVFSGFRFLFIFFWYMSDNYSIDQVFFFLFCISFREHLNYSFFHCFENQFRCISFEYKQFFCFNT